MRRNALAINLKYTSITLTLCEVHIPLGRRLRYRMLSLGSMMLWRYSKEVVLGDDSGSVSARTYIGKSLDLMVFGT